jgi:hypothetical protein
VSPSLHARGQAASNLGRLTDQPPSMGHGYLRWQTTIGLRCACGTASRIELDKRPVYEARRQMSSDRPPLTRSSKTYCNTRRRVASSTATLNGFCKMAAALCVDFGSTA